MPNLHSRLQQTSDQVETLVSLTRTESTEDRSELSLDSLHGHLEAMEFNNLEEEALEDAFEPELDERDDEVDGNVKQQGF